MKINCRANLARLRGERPMKPITKGSESMMSPPARATRRPNDGLARAERVALAYAVEVGNGDLPPAIAKLIQFAPESFGYLREGKIAAVIRSMRGCGEAVYAESVGAKSGESLFISSELPGSLLPRDIAELEAETALAAFEIRRAQSVFDDAANSLRSSPAQAKNIIAGAIRSLDDLAGKDRDGLTIRRPDELLAMTFADTDRILGDRLLADSGQLTLLGAGGTGKSRLLLQLLACIATGRKFLTFDTFKSEMKWLVLQTENSNRRLQQDLARLKSWLGDDWPRFAERVVIHTIETDVDGFVNLDDPDAVARIAISIQADKPDGVVFDPLNDFAMGDLNSDRDMKLTLQTLSRLCRKGNPLRAIIVLHHALTGKGGAVKATGYDRSSFARNSKMLHAWARGQINLAPVDAVSNDRLIVGCGKCSNGPEFQTFAVRLNRDTMIYECDPSVDVTEWAKDITGQRDNDPLMDPVRVGQLCRSLMTKGDLAKAIMADCGCYRGSAYRYIVRAEGKTIKFDKTNDTYFPK
jgi:AAA domain